jgi:hypothetical protein
MPPAIVFDLVSGTHATYHTCEPRTRKEIGSWKETYHIWDPRNRYIHMRGLRWTKVTYYRTMHVVNDLPHTWTWDQERNGTLKGNLPRLGSTRRIKQRWGLRRTKVTYYSTMYVVNRKNPTLQQNWTNSGRRGVWGKQTEKCLLQLYLTGSWVHMWLTTHVNPGLGKK